MSIRASGMDHSHEKGGRGQKAVFSFSSRPNMTRLAVEEIRERLEASVALHRIFAETLHSLG